MSRTRTIWLLFGIVVVAVALRSYHITARSIWFDESFTWRLISFPISELINRTAEDVHPPLYYILVKYWAVVFGASARALRSFSILCAALSVLGGYFFTAEAFRSRRAGITAAIFLALSPWTIAYAWEARMYTLGMTLALFSSFVLIRALRKKSFKWFALYGILTAAFFYTHYYALLTIVAQVVALAALFLWQTKGRVGEIIHDRSFWGALCGCILAFLLISPWISRFLAQQSQVQESYWVPRIGLVSVPDTLYRIFVPTIDLPSRTGIMAVILLLPLAIMIIVWVMLGAWRDARTSDGAYLTLALGLVPFILGVTISLGSRSLYNDRFFAFAGIFIFVALAGVIDRITALRFRNGIVMCFVIFSSWAYVRSWKEIDITQSPGVHGAMEFVAGHRKNTDSILTSSPYIYFPLAHYAKEEFRIESSLHLYSAAGTLSHFSGAPIAISSDAASVQDIATYTGTVWIIDTTGFTEKPLQAPSNWQEVSRTVFPEVFVHQGDIIVRQMRVL